MNGNDSACIANIAVMLAPIRSFRVRVLSAVSQILPRPTPVAMVTKFKTKSATTPLVYEISPRYLRLTGVLGVMLSNDVVIIYGNEI